MPEQSYRSVVVTGAASGIGHALAQECAHRGMRVFPADVSGARPVDVRRSADVDAFAASVYSATDAVDLVFNNAGVMPVSDLIGTTQAQWQHVIDVNVHGVMNVVRAFVPHLRAQRRPGCIVNTASLAGLAPPVEASCGAYAATKSAVVSLSETLARELEPDGIRVAVVCPSGVTTNIFGDEPHAPAPPNLMAPALAARRILDGVEAGRFYVFTHTDPVAQARVLDRVAAIEADLRAAAGDHGETMQI